MSTAEHYAEDLGVGSGEVVRLLARAAGYSGRHVAVRQDGDLPVAEPAQRPSALVLGHRAPNRRSLDALLRERRGQRLHMCDVHAEGDCAPTRSETAVAPDDEPIALVSTA